MLLKLLCVKQASIFLSVPPSPELVERVRDLYHKRVPDVRFLIPVINGLEKVKTNTLMLDTQALSVLFYSSMANDLITNKWFAM